MKSRFAAGVLAFGLFTSLTPDAVVSAAEGTGGSGAEALPPLRVMSFNIRYGAASDGDNSWTRRRDLVVKTIRDTNPDLLGMQEVLVFQADFVKRGLPEYAFHGVGRDDGKEAGEFSPVMWRKDRFELLDSGHFWLSETPEIPGSMGWDTSITRMVSWVALRDLRAGGRELVYANTHFDHRGPQARLESAKLIQRKAGDVPPGMPIILTGDFNTTEDDPPYAVLVKGAGETGGVRFHDSYRVVHPERSPDEVSFNGWKPVVKGSRIDWVLYTDGFTTVEAHINRVRENGRVPSDHYPVDALLRWE
ncbi:MAG: endonuclease/exonuclease/phosphatase family protein [Verrucomicrobiales bacterium]|nr:endonuclease/exonuclease/phosphatase family protein [Verrucomicrobiales bacterium]